MNRITVNRSNAKSILIGGALAARQNQAKLGETDKDGTNFKKIFEDEYPKESLETNYAVGLLEREDGAGDNLALGITSLHHDLNNFDTQMELKAIFAGDKAAIKRTSEAGAVISKYRQSPAFKNEFNINEPEEEKEVETGDSSVKADKGLNQEGDDPEQAGPVTNVNNPDSTELGSTLSSDENKQ